MIWPLFIGSAVIILFAATKLALYADVIAKRTKLGTLWVGSVLLAGATSLPELVTSISAALLNLPDIAIGNVFGSNIFNLLNVAVIDVFFAGGAILASIPQGHILSATLGMLLSGVAAVSILLGIKTSVLGVGVDTLLIALIYLFGLTLLLKHNGGKGGRKVPSPLNRKKSDEMPIKSAIVGFVISALIIMVAGVTLSITGDKIALITGLGGTFVGSILIAAATSLPETVAGIAAVRHGALELAIGNFLGSNIFNMVILIAADIAFRGAPILDAVSTNHAVTALFGLIMAAVVVMAIFYRSKKTYFRLGVDSCILIVVYLLATYMLFINR